MKRKVIEAHDDRSTLINFDSRWMDGWCRLLRPMMDRLLPDELSRRSIS